MENDELCIDPFNFHLMCDSEVYILCSIMMNFRSVLCVGFFIECSTPTKMCVTF